MSITYHDACILGIAFQRIAEFVAEKCTVWNPQDILVQFQLYAAAGRVSADNTKLFDDARDADAACWYWPDAFVAAGLHFASKRVKDWAVQDYRDELADAMYEEIGSLREDIAAGSRMLADGGRDALFGGVGRALPRVRHILSNTPVGAA